MKVYLFLRSMADSLQSPLFVVFVVQLANHPTLIHEATLTDSLHSQKGGIVVFK